MEINGDVITWLLAGDPAIRWQVIQDILHADRVSVENEREKISREGWGALLLSHQNNNGLWAGQVYDHKWISTTYTMLLLRQMGLNSDHPQAQRACDRLLEGGWQPEGFLSFSKSKVMCDLGVNGMVLSILAYFHCVDERVHRIAEYLLEHQSGDGHWDPYLGNICLKYQFDTTLQVLEGLSEYTLLNPERKLIFDSAIRLGIEFLLHYRLYLNDRDEPLEKKWTQFSFPPRWHYDVLAVMDYLYRTGTEYDDRMKNAMSLIKLKMRRNGRLSLQNRHPGKTFFEMEIVGEPSRWNTLRALRVLSIKSEF